MSAPQPARPARPLLGSRTSSMGRQNLRSFADFATSLSTPSSQQPNEPAQGIRVPSNTPDANQQSNEPAQELRAPNNTPVPSKQPTAHQYKPIVLYIPEAHWPKRYAIAAHANLATYEPSETGESEDYEETFRKMKSVKHKAGRTADQLRRWFVRSHATLHAKCDFDYFMVVTAVADAPREYECHLYRYPRFFDEEGWGTDAHALVDTAEIDIGEDWDLLIAAPAA